MIGAGVASLAASLARYEGWFVIPFVALYFLFAARKNRIEATLLFLTLRCLVRSTGSVTIGGSIPIRSNSTTGRIRP